MAVPILWSIAGCFARIQNFLLLPERVDSRSSTTTSPSGYESGGPAQSTEEDARGSEYELLNLSTTQDEEPEIYIVDASFVFEASSEPILKDVNLRIPQSGFVVVMGDVGSGKTTLLRAILGEVPVRKGVIHVAQHRVAYCGQTTWVRNISIRKNILGEGSLDPAWYATVVDACLLNEDFQHLPQGDDSLAGSGGSALSGGQRQRVVCRIASRCNRASAKLTFSFLGLGASPLF